jgi:hypothetical protein
MDVQVCSKPSLQIFPSVLVHGLNLRQFRSGLITVLTKGFHLFFVTDLGFRETHPYPRSDVTNYRHAIAHMLLRLASFSAFPL